MGTALTTNHPPYSILIDSEAKRAKAMEALRRAPLGYSVRIEWPEPDKTSPQTRRFHGMIRDITKAMPEYGGVWMDEDSWKDVILDALFEGKTRMVPKLNRMGMMALNPHWKPLTIKQAMDAIDIAQAWGDQNRVPFTADKLLEGSYQRLTG